MPAVRGDFKNGNSTMKRTGRANGKTQRKERTGLRITIEEESADFSGEPCHETRPKGDDRQHQ